MSDRSQFSEEQLAVIGDYVKRNLGSWLREVGPQSGQIQTVAYTDPQLIERIATVETELKAQRDLMQQGFAQMEKRFEQIDKRFEEQRADMNDRFTQVDKRFDDMHRHTSRWMTALMIVVALTSLAATVTNMMG
jgi:hypothetical protein